MKHEFGRHTSEKSSNIKFHEIPSSGGICYMRTDEQIYMRKLIVSNSNNCNLAKTPKIHNNPLL